MRISQTPRYLPKVLLKHLGKIFFSVMFLLVATNSSIEKVTAQKDDPSNVWINSTPIKRPPDKGRKRKSIVAPFLTMRWQVLTLGRKAEISANNCVEEPINPAGFTFTDKDAVRLAVQVNQKGYLYLINHTEAPDGRIIEGPKLISAGQYEVEKDLKQLLPPTCPKDESSCGQCWWRMYSPAGREVVTVIFSRDKINQLANNSGYDLMVSASYIEELKRNSPNPKHQLWDLDSQKKSRLTGVTGHHVTMVWNPNASDNEMLIERITLNHQ